VRESEGTVGATLIGRRTFDLGLGPWGGTPFPGIPSFVVTHRTREDLLGDNGGTFAFDGLQAAARRAKDAAGDKDVWVLGADIARQLLGAGLLDLRVRAGASQESPASAPERKMPGAPRRGGCRLAPGAGEGPPRDPAGPSNPGSYRPVITRLM
jgi:hypothetical protein